MREIKFRAWHVPQKTMYSAEVMAADQLTLLPTGSFINVHSTSTRLSEIYPADKFIPLQYTGLKDKNGKEIYEGDILLVELQPYGCPQIDIFEVFWDTPSTRFKIRDKNQDGWSFDNTNKMDVIGNIYENKELLT